MVFRCKSCLLHAENVNVVIVVAVVLIINGALSQTNSLLWGFYIKAFELNVSLDGVFWKSQKKPFTSNVEFYLGNFLQRETADT